MAAIKYRYISIRNHDTLADEVISMDAHSRMYVHSLCATCTIDDSIVVVHSDTEHGVESFDMYSLDYTLVVLPKRKLDHPYSGCIAR